MLLQSRLAECGLTGFLEQYLINSMVNLAIIMMNIRSVGVQYMRANPDRFIESIAGDSWARYLPNMSEQGT